MIHPLLNSKQSILYYIGVWIVVMITLFITSYYLTNKSLSFCFIDSVLSGVIYGIISLSLWFSIKYGTKSKTRFGEIIVSNILLYTILTSIWLILTLFVYKLFYYQWYLDTLNSIFPIKIVISLILYVKTILVYYAISFYQSLRQMQANEMELKNLIREAQLNELRSQLHPHFLFNSLNSINSLTISNPPKAGEMIVKLSEYLRYSLSRKNHSMATLESELSHIKLYLDIEKIRFGNRLKVEYSVEFACYNHTLPLMIMQPIFENAIKHGVYNSVETVTILFSAKIVNEIMLITISNNYDLEYTQKRGTGTGLKNVEDRLKLVYGKMSLIDIKKEANNFIVTLQIPKQ